MPGHTRSRAVSILSASLLLTFVCLAAEAQIRFDLPAQPLSQALTTLGSLANLNIYFDAPTVDGIQAPALKADLSADDALTRLLAGTRLRAVRVDEHTFRVVAQPDSERAQAARNPATGAVRPPTSVHLALAGVGSGDASSTLVDSSAGDAAAGDSARSDGLQQVIVTAEKRNERLQDVPVPVTSINADSLVNDNQLLLRDYYTQIPGLNVVPTVQSQQILSIRGITTGVGNPTVGITVDEVPFGSSALNGGGGVVPDIDPSDLARIEVLRGPQGTLYGASSMGGLVKFVTVDPSTDRVSGHLQAGADSIHNSAGLGYNVRGSVNVPLSDTFAVRASAFFREDPGYIDNPVLHLDGVNEDHAAGGLLTGLWRPMEDFSVKLTALYQRIKSAGSSDVDISAPGSGLPPLGDLQQSYVRGVGAYDRQVQSYSASVHAKLGAIDLTSLTGFNVNSFSDSLDDSSGLGTYANLFFNVGGAPIVYDNRTQKLTQELRLSVALGSHLDWLIGGFYTHERSSYIGDILAADPTTGTIAGHLLDTAFPTTYTESAAFTDLTYRITDQMDIQIGGRESRITQTYRQAEGGALTGNVVVTLPQANSSANAFTYLITPRFRLSPSFMTYARFASGYRAGGPNPTPGGIVPTQYNPDKTKNYEIGIKGDFLDHALTIDASAYYIKWDDIQLTLFNQATVSSYNANGGSARSDGVELSLEAKPYRGLTLSGWIVWNNAVLTQDFPASSTVTGRSGERLPYSSRFSGHLAAEWDFPLYAELNGFVGGMLSYVGDREGAFVPAPPRQVYPGYAKTDLHGGVLFSSWTISVFAENITDRRGELNGGAGVVPPFAFTFIQPRTVGITATRSF